jgi:shikimate kinase
MGKTNIALIGFMATGKSTIGRILAKKLNKDFIEMDYLIAERAGKSIPEIFAQDGEIRFREMEMAIAKEMGQVKNTVISTGGGIVMNKLNIDYLKLSSTVVLLAAPAEEIYNRIMKEGKEKRPMIDKPDPKAEITRLLLFRQPFYEAAADITINTREKTPEAIAEEILNFLKI